MSTSHGGLGRPNPRDPTDRSGGSTRSDLDGDYDLAVSDATFRARVETQYSGRHAVLDALWWRAHPLDPAPGGAPSPREGLRTLRTIVYSAPKPGASSATDAARLASLEAALTADDRSIEEAVARARERQSPQDTLRLPGTGAPGSATTPIRTPTSTSSTPGSVLPADLATPEGGQSARAERERGAERQPGGEPRHAMTGPRRVLLVAVLAAVMSVAFLAGMERQAGVGGLEPQASASPARARALAIFDTAAPTDPIAANARTVLGVAVVPSSLRQLSYRVGPGADFFAARDRQGRVCLVAVINYESFASSCMTDAAFSRTPLRLDFVLPETKILDTDPIAVVRDVSVEWTPDGISRGLVAVR